MRIYEGGGKAEDNNEGDKEWKEEEKEREVNNTKRKKNDKRWKWNMK